MDALKKQILLRVIAGVLALCFLFFICLAVYGIVERKILYPLKYKDEIIFYSEKYGLESATVFAVVNIESGFKKDAVSKKGATGLMQINKSTGEYIANTRLIESYDLTDVETNLDFGCYYLKYLTGKFYDMQTVICAYNAGEGNVDGWLKNREYSEDGKRLKDIPFSETKSYLKKFNESYKKYKNLYGKLLDKV